MRLSYLTRGNSTPNGKPRILVICHPEEYSAHLQQTANDLFATQNCVVWYPEDLGIPDPAGFELIQMQLLVFAVSKRLLTEYADAVRHLLEAALSHNIPVLPIQTEHGLRLLFSEVFGSLQYLDRMTIDPTALPYPERLAAYLNSVLLNDEQISQIKAAFDAYIFLSYRKKDRAHAQELMRLIHTYPFCERVAIWYDEFLTPGEDFNDSIRHALQKSHLFALVVTPNTVSGQNYIIRTEYPMAVQEAKSILPVEMVQTAQDALHECFAEIPEPVNGHDADSLEHALRDYLLIGLNTNHNDPVHTFLVGLAYLSGIDVEVDRERAFRLISSAAEAGVLPAMKQLALMYQNGQGVRRDLSEAIRRQKNYTGMLGDIAEDSMSEEDVIAFLREEMLLGDMAVEAEDYDTATDAFSVSYNVAKKLSYGAFSRNIIQKAKVWVNKFILNRSPYFEEAFHAFSRCALRLMEIALEEDIYQDIQEWSRRAVKLVRTASIMYSDEKTAADLLSLSAGMTVCCMKNGNTDGALIWMKTTENCWSGLPESDQTPGLRFLYTKCIAAGCEYYAAVQDFDSVFGAMKMIKGILQQLAGEYPDNPQFRFERIGTLLTETHFYTVCREFRSAEACLAEAEQMLAQEDPDDTDHSVLTASLLYRKGEFLAKTGEPEVAVELLSKGRDILEQICKRLFDVKHSDELVSLIETLGDCHTTLGEFEEAHKCYKRAIGIHTELLRFSKSLRHIERAASLFEKMVDSCIRVKDCIRLNEWYDKALFARNSLATGVVTSGIRQRKVVLPKAEAAYQRLLARKDEIWKYLREARADTSVSLRSSVKEDIQEEPVTAAQMETEMLAFLKTYLNTHRPMKILDDIYALQRYLEERQHSAVPDPKKDLVPFMALDRIQKFMLDHYKPFIRYDEEDVILLTFCGYYYIIRTTSGLQRKQEAMKGFMRFFNDIAFWPYSADSIKYPQMWRHLYYWVNCGNLVDPFGTGNV